MDQNQSKIIKWRLVDKKLEAIDDFNIYKYFQYHDSVFSSKLIAAVCSGIYAANYDHSDRCDHYGMIIELENQLGPYDCYVGSGGSEFNVFYNNQLNDKQIDILIFMLKELQQYYLDTNINKNISFIGNSLDYELESKLRTCLDIDEIIELLTEKQKKDIYCEERKNSK